MHGIKIVEMILRKELTIYIIFQGQLKLILAYRVSQIQIWMYSKRRGSLVALLVS